MGNLLSVAVHNASKSDTKIGLWVASFAFFLYPTIENYCGDGGYRKTFVEEVQKYLGAEVIISKKITPHDWQVISPRWIVERTFAWLNYSRRLSKNFEYTMSSAETMVKISHIYTLLKRL